MPISQPTIAEVTGILQASISPIAVISGVGLLILSMTNRYGRVIDRVRILLKSLEEKQAEAGGNISSQEAKESLPELPQLQILYNRAVVLRMSIIMSSATVFFIGIAISGLFVNQLFKFDLVTIIYGSFLLALLTMIISLGYFMWDITLSLKALKRKIYQQIPGDWLDKPLKSI